MKYFNLISVVFILIFGLFETISGMAVPNDCTVIEEVINTIGNDLQKSYKSNTLNSCCDFSQIICQDFNNQTAVTEIKFNNYKNLSNQDMGKIISQFAKLQHLTTLEMANNLIVGELPNNLSELKNLQILDLSGNCLEDNNANTKLNIKKLNLSNADSCINKNKEEKDLGNNTFIKVYTIIMFIFTVIFILQGICAGTCLCFEKATLDICIIIVCLIYFIIYFILFGSLLIGIYKGKLNYMLVFKYGYLVVLILTVMDRICSWTSKCISKSEGEENTNIAVNLCCSSLVLALQIVYYILAENYIIKYENYLKN